MVRELPSLGGVSASGDQAELASHAIAVALALIGAVAFVSVMFRLS
jgi:hypothetical protein